MKNGFTLMELLAVFVVLAIISLIAVPMIYNAIIDSEEQSARFSVEHYIDAINSELSNQEVIGLYENLDGIYEISSNGKVLTNENNIVLNIDYKGTALTEGHIVVENGSVKQLNSAKVDKWYAKIESGKVILIDEVIN